MRGTLVRKTWKSDPTLYAPPKYRKACRYEAFIPEALIGFEFDLASGIAGVVSDAEQAIMKLNASDRPALAPLARLLLRTESIASSKVEGMQVGIRQLARAESKIETGGKASSTILEVLGNIDAMQLAIDEAATAEQIGVEHLTAIHGKLMANAPNSQFAGVVRREQNWIGGNDYNPCGADFVLPPPEHVDSLLRDLCEAAADDSLPPLVQAAIIHAQFETIHPFDDGNGRTGRALVHVVLRRRGIAASYVPPISVVLAAERDRYVRGLIGFRSGEVGPWIEQFAAAAARAAGLAADYRVGRDRVDAYVAHPTERGPSPKVRCRRVGSNRGLARAPCPHRGGRRCRNRAIQGRHPPSHSPAHRLRHSPATLGVQAEPLVGGSWPSGSARGS